MDLYSNSALVGHTGLVGTNLLRTRTFDDLFNSSNIADIEGRQFDLLVCAGAPANMWAANQDPAADAANLATLGNLLGTLKIKNFVLISTIAVFDDVSAGYDEESVSYEATKAYGRNRRSFEARLQASFPDIRILRLPALFGLGLKKNFVFDILNPVPSFLKTDRFESLQRRLNPSLLGVLTDLYRYDPVLTMMVLDRPALDRSSAKPELEQAIMSEKMEAARFTNSASQFQYFDLSLLANYIDAVIESDLRIVNIWSEPISAEDIHVELRGAPFSNDAPTVVREDMHTIHAERFGGVEPYMFDRTDTLARLRAFYCAASS